LRKLGGRKNFGPVKVCWLGYVLRPEEKVPDLFGLPAVKRAKQERKNEHSDHPL